MACFYTGFNYFCRKNGIFKLGETGKDTPAQRLSSIRQNEHFQCLAWIKMPKATKSERLAVEAHARLKMSYLFEQVQNDHFLYKITPNRKYEQAQEMANLAIGYAVEACEMYNISYSMGTKEYKRG